MAKINITSPSYASVVKRISPTPVISPITVCLIEKLNENYFELDLDLELDDLTLTSDNLPSEEEYEEMDRAIKVVPKKPKIKLIEDYF